MKAIISAGLILICATAAHAWEAEGWRAKVEASLPNDFENVIEAHWSQRISLWVTVRDNGSRRDFYAQAICIHLRDEGMPADDYVDITIWDYAKMGYGDLVELGGYVCQT